jgi:hypothetical protein
MLYLPPLTATTMRFLQQVLEGNKKLLGIKDTVVCTVPKYAEFSVKKIYQEFSENHETMLHLPDLNEHKKLPDRKFVVTVVVSLHKEYFSEIIHGAREVRLQEKMFNDK